MANAVPEFREHSRVINGCSDLFVDIFGERHARSAIGVGSLPFGITVEIEAIFEVDQWVEGSGSPRSTTERVVGGRAGSVLADANSRPACVYAAGLSPGLVPERVQQVCPSVEGEQQ